MRKLIHSVLTALILFLSACTLDNDSQKSAQPKPQEGPIQTVGTADGAGGGDYYKQLFWALTKEIQSKVSKPATNNHLTDEQIKRLTKLMDPEVIALEFVKEPLYLIIHGIKTQVTALNYPGNSKTQPKIKIDITRAPQFFDTFRESRGFILHEFLGLAKIDDTHYKLSNLYYPPQYPAVLFNYKKVNCFYSAPAADFLSDRIQAGHIIRFRNPDKDHSVAFSDTVIKKGSTQYNKEESKYRYATFDIPISTSRDQNTPRNFLLKIKLTLKAGNTYLGSGAAKYQKSYVNGQLKILARLYKYDPINKTTSDLIGLADQSIRSFKENQSGKIDFQMSNLLTHQFFDSLKIDEDLRFSEKIAVLDRRYPNLSELTDLIYKSTGDTLLFSTMNIFCELSLNSE